MDLYYLHYEYKQIVRIALASLMYYVICYILLRVHTILYKNKYSKAIHSNKFDGFLLFRKICNAYTFKFHIYHSDVTLGGNFEILKFCLAAGEKNCENKTKRLFTTCTKYMI